MPINMTVHAATRQSGSFLLEALIATLLVAFAILGSIGLLARSMQNVDDAKFRGEAAFLANSLIGNMWIADHSNLVAQFDSGSGGAGYLEFQNLVNQRLPNAASLTQDVTITPGPTPTSSDVVITIRWIDPGDLVPGFIIDDAHAHKYQVAATIGTNCTAPFVCP